MSEETKKEIPQDEVDALLNGLGGYRIRKEDEIINENSEETLDDALNTLEEKWSEELDNSEQDLSKDEDETEELSDNIYVGGSYVDSQKSRECTRLPRLEIICDRFARYATVYLTNLFKIRVELNPISIETRPFGEIMRSLPVPTSINIVKTNNVFSGNMISAIDSRLVFSLIESAFGGWASSQPKIEGREFTTIEQEAVKIAHEQLLEAMNVAWREFIVNITFSLEKTEINPQFSCITKPDEPCLQIFFEVELDVSLGSVYWFIPLSSIKSFYSLLQQYPDNSMRVITCTDEEFVQFCLSQKENEKRRKLLTIDPNRKWLEIANSIPIPRLAQFLRNDHPQTLACIFSYLKPHIAAQHLLTFPAGVRPEIVTRMEKVCVRNPIFLQMLDNFISYINWTPETLNLGKGKQVLAALTDISPEAKQEIEEDIREDMPYFFNDDYTERFR